MEVWTTMVLEELFAKTTAAQWFTNLSPFATEGGDIFHVPDVYTNAFTVQTQSTQGTEVTLGSPTQVDVTLTVNNHVYIAYIIDDLARAQLSRNFAVSEVYARKAGGTLATDLEGDIYALWSGLTTNTVGDTATVLSDAEIRQGVEKLASANFDLRESAFHLHPYVNFRRTLWETISTKLRKLREHLIETIRSETQKWGRSETIIGGPYQVVLGAMG